MSKVSLQKSVGARIRNLRKDQGMTLQEFALASGKARQVIERIEAGRVNPEIYTLKELALGLGITLESLLKGLK